MHDAAVRQSGMSGKDRNLNEVNNQQARRLLSSNFVIDSEFDGFIQDCWPEVKIVFATGMDRVTRVNILLAKVPAEEIVSRIDDYLTAGVEEKERSKFSAPTDRLALNCKSNFTVDDARTWLIKSCLAILLFSVLFFLIAPFLGYPIEFDCAVRMLQIVVPVFLGYVGQSVYLMTRNGRKNCTVNIRKISKSIKILIQGPIVVYSVSFTALSVAFWLSNRASAELGIGITPSGFSMGISALTAGLAMTTNLTILFLFGD